MHFWPYLQIGRAIIALPVLSANIHNYNCTSKLICKLGTGDNGGAMNISEFQAGTYKQQYEYKSFFPSLVNKKWEITDPDLIVLLSEADRKLGELNAFSQLIPDIDFFIKMHVAKEATTSNRIEGTQTNISDAVQTEENIDLEKKDDWMEVQNYITAMNNAIKELDNLPLSNRLISQTHRLLLQGVRGKHKLPGEFRKSQNWIGGFSLKDAIFIPPHHADLPDLMSDFEKFLHNEDYPLPHLIRIGIAHYQFETLHPFLDGNGRVGRLMITLYLVSRGLLIKPTLYLSDFFEKNKTLYYDNLTRVRTNHDLTNWLRYFLRGIRQTAENSIETFQSIIAIREEMENKQILTLGKKTRLAVNFIHYLYTKPIVDSQETAKALDIHVSTANRLIEDFIRLDILKEITGYKRNKQFSFHKYLALFE